MPRRCYCGSKIKYGPIDGSGKRHGHCTKCRVEWHWTGGGRMYSHPMPAKKKKKNGTKAINMHGTPKGHIKQMFLKALERMKEKQMI